jgi:hypothetical protein
LGLLETFGAVWISSSYKDAIGMVILIVILLIAPQGLVGFLRGIRSLVAIIGNVQNGKSKNILRRASCGF